MVKRRIYIDTSVFGGCFDEEFEQDSKMLFQRIEKGEFIVFFSELTETELSLANREIQEIKTKIPSNQLQYVRINEDSNDLANKYIEEKILGPSSTNDAHHIALATLNRVDVLISWNFKHIVNYEKIKLFNSVNLKLGYTEIDIRSPKEFIDYGDKS